MEVHKKLHVLYDNEYYLEYAIFFFLLSHWSILCIYDHLFYYCNNKYNGPLYDLLLK